MKLYCVNVGYGDAFLFHGETGCCLLDTGSGLPGEYEGSEARIRAADFLRRKGIGEIDCLILSHVHEDHIGMLKVMMREFGIRELRIPEGFCAIDTPAELPEDFLYRKKSTRLFHRALNEFAEAMQLCRERQIPVRELKKGDQLSVAGLLIRALGAERARTDCFLRKYEALRRCVPGEKAERLLEEMDACANASSMLLKISCGAFAGLFCGDNVPKNWAEDVRAQLSDVSFVKLPHHGQIDAVDRKFMRELPMRCCLTTASSDRRYGSANPAVYEVLAAWAAEDGRELRCLFTDPAEDCAYRAVSGGYHAIAVELDSSMNVTFEYPAVPEKRE